MELLGGELARARAMPEPEVRRLRQNRRVEQAWHVGRPPPVAAQRHQVVSEAGLAINLDQQLGQIDLTRPSSNLTDMYTFVFDRRASRIAHAVAERLRPPNRGLTRLTTAGGGVRSQDARPTGEGGDSAPYLVFLFAPPSQACLAAVRPR